MSLLIRLECEPTLAALEAARDELNGLIEDLSQKEAAGPDDRGEPAATDSHSAEHTASRLRAELGETTWGLLYACASNFEGRQEFSLAELAKRLGVELPTVRARHRSASKVIKRIGDPDDVLPKRWDTRAHSNQYWLTPEMRQAILNAGP